MIHRTSRPLSDAERQLLSPTRAWRPSWTAGLGAAATSFILVFLLGLLVLGFLGETSNPAVNLNAAVSGAVALIVYFRAWRRERQFGAGTTVADDLAAGEVMVWSVAATSAIAVEEFEDEGLSYYFALDDGQVLFLSGQYLYDIAEDERFPSDRFELVRTAATSTVLTVTVRGERLASVEQRPPFTAEEFLEHRVPEDGTILPGPLSRYRGAAV